MTRFLKVDDEKRVRELIHCGQGQSNPERARDCYLDAYAYLNEDFFYLFCVLNLMRMSLKIDIRQEAMDISQEAMVAVYEAMPGFRGAAMVNTWIHSIVRYTVAKYLRKLRIEIPIGIDPRTEGEAQPDAIDELRRAITEWGLDHFLRFGNRRERKDAWLFIQHDILGIPLTELVRRRENRRLAVDDLRERLEAFREKLRRRLENGH